MQHDRQTGTPNDLQQFLGLAQTVGREYGGDLVRQGLSAKVHDAAFDLLPRWKHIAREAKGCLHDEHVGPGRDTGLGGAVGPQLEIPGVEEGTLVGGGVQHRRAEDMTGGKKFQLTAKLRRPGLTVVEDGFATFAVQPQPHQAGGGAGRHDFPVRRNMVGMRVGDEGARLRAPGVEPPADLRQMHASIEAHFPGHGASRVPR